MVNRHISSDLKERALALWEAGWSREDICYAFHVSPRSLYRWRSIFEEFGKVTKPPSPFRGRERIIGLGVLNAAKEVYFHDSSVMLHLAIHYDIAISISALQATLARAGLTRKVLQTIAVERDEAQRTECRGCILDPTSFSGTGMEFLAVDESSKDERTLARHHGRAPVGQPAIYPHQFVRDDRYTLTAAMRSTQGYIATRIVEGSMDAYQFFDFIVEDVVRKHSLYSSCPR
ncbi:DDE-3 domain-containing protein [Favolaschia claudopus]|uniref:DDE-3 domain-containing protein n=1 Tax=Favolaschia claudopus TaxID=2862362 RepID=A0AAV9Z400_9AGAR